MGAERRPPQPGEKKLLPHGCNFQAEVWRRLELAQGREEGRRGEELKIHKDSEVMAHSGTPGRLYF